MKFGIASLSLASILATSSNNHGVAAFSLRTAATPMTTTSRTASTSTSTSTSTYYTPQQQHYSLTSSRTSSLSMSSSSSLSSSPSDTTANNEQDDEITRLKAMAQKLRSEAASLEAEQAGERAKVARLAFEKFDNKSDPDGKISLAELKAGLEASLKTELKEERVQKLMDKFDTSGDGYLQLEEMVSVDQFRNQLEAFSREEKSVARTLVQEAQKEEEASRLAEAKLEFLNEKEPTQTDKINRQYLALFVPTLGQFAIRTAYPH